MWFFAGNPSFFFHDSGLLTCQCWQLTRNMYMYRYFFLCFLCRVIPATSYSAHHNKLIECRLPERHYHQGHCSIGRPPKLTKFMGMDTYGSTFPFQLWRAADRATILEDLITCAKFWLNVTAVVRILGSHGLSHSWRWNVNGPSMRTGIIHRSVIKKHIEGVELITRNHKYPT